MAIAKSETMKPTILFTAAAAVMLFAACDGDGKTRNRSAASAATGHRTNAPARGQVDWARQIVATPEGGFRMGNPNAPVKIVEFGSMTCHVCRDFSAQSTPALEDKYVRSGKVSYELRNYIRDPYDVVAALLARCGGPRPYFKLTEQLFTEQNAFVAKAQAITPAQAQAISVLPRPQQFVRLAAIMGLDRFADVRGIPAAKANACLTNQAELDRLLAMTQAADKDFGVTGTPTFVINGKVIDRTVSWADLEPRLNAALGR